jgi:hypothetical protein
LVNTEVITKSATVCAIIRLSIPGEYWQLPVEEIQECGIVSAVENPNYFGDRKGGIHCRFPRDHPTLARV